MKLLDDNAVEAALERLPGISLNWKQPVDSTYSVGSGARGRYEYVPVGMRRRATGVAAEGIWGGGCFASWKRIPPNHQVTRMYLENYADKKVFPDSYKDFCQIAWDTVIHPCFSYMLPDFETLRKTDELMFDTSEVSWTEASLNWRLARVWNECISFVRTAGILRHKYPDQPAPVLLAATTLNRFEWDEGYTLGAHPQSPNSTLNTYGNFPNALAMCRALEWASRTGRFDIRQLTTSTRMFGPYSRQYFGFDNLMHGHGKTFKVNLGKLNSDERDAASDPRMVGLGWENADTIIAWLEMAYDQSRGKDPTQKIDLAIKDDEKFAAFLAKELAEPSRLY